MLRWHTFILVYIQTFVRQCFDGKGNTPHSSTRRSPMSQKHIAPTFEIQFKSCCSKHQLHLSFFVDETPTLVLVVVLLDLSTRRPPARRRSTHQSTIGIATPTLSIVCVVVPFTVNRSNMTVAFEILQYLDDLDEELLQVLDVLVLRTFIPQLPPALALDAASHDDGDIISVQQKPRRVFDSQFCRCYVMEKVLGRQATIDFSLVFRISVERFNVIHDRIRAMPNNEFFFTKNGAGVPPAARMLLPLQCLAFGCAPIAFAHFYQMSPALARSCCQHFDNAMCTLFLAEFLRKPTPDDLKNIEALHHDQHGVPGMFGCLDCMHVVWKNCPKAWHGMYQGKEKEPTLVLEGVCDYNLYFWHAFFGAAGSQNDINVLKLSRLMNSFIHGDFHLREREAGVVPYEINGETFNELFILVDGIYPRYSRFLKSFKEAVEPHKKAYSAWHEGTRKDIERGFGVLQGQWKWLAYPIHALDTRILSRRLKTCLILHNMNVSDRIMGDVNLTYNPCHGRTVPDRETLELPVLPMQGWNDRCRLRDLMNLERHIRLQNAVLANYVP